VDGRKHVNLFTYQESVEFSEGFGKELEKVVSLPSKRSFAMNNSQEGLDAVNFVRDLGNL
jgi:hypothetical protein